MSTANQFLVSARGEKILILKARYEMSQEEAMNLAAWLAVMTDPEEVARLIQAIETGGAK
jgi:hypothetical protein